MIIGTAAMPLLLLSAWSAIPVALSVTVLVVRTKLEDAMLERELDGYRAYAIETRHRIVPGIW
jgi:protein-S-isoprenylcysteine O-methyltransferase Ste14